jgi:hypothetical protein
MDLFVIFINKFKSEIHNTSISSEDDLYTYAHEKFLKYINEIEKEYNVSSDELCDDEEWYDEYHDDVVLEFCKILNNNLYNTYFQCLGLDIVSRGDYESMPCPMYAGEFDNDKMAELAEKIYLCLTNQYRYTDKDLEKYFNDQTAKIDYDLDMVFWREMENIAIEMGMRYYEDMTDEEYNEINKK